MQLVIPYQQPNLITVSDTTAPRNIAPANITTTTDSDTCVATTVDLGLPTSGDNCTLILLPMMLQQVFQQE